VGIGAQDSLTWTRGQSCPRSNDDGPKRYGKLRNEPNLSGSQISGSQI
jgi:hypothetical protein